MALATWILQALGLYAAAGLAVAAAFLTWGVGRVVSGAHGAGLLFRLTILPGVVVLWPAVLVRWVSLARRSAA